MIYMKSTYLNLYSRKNNYSKENIIPVRYFENPTVTRFPKKKKNNSFSLRNFPVGYLESKVVISQANGSLKWLYNFLANQNGLSIFNLFYKYFLVGTQLSPGQEHCCLKACSK